MTDTLVWFDEDACRDVRVAGGKGASLAAMAARLAPLPPATRTSRQASSSNQTSVSVTRPR